ncbi:MAG: hypothetical protein Q9M39_03435 [Sulfurovum sp.]|nr:hypothetical protein [Sulfurovum sp.]
MKTIFVSEIDKLYTFDVFMLLDDDTQTIKGTNKGDRVCQEGVTTKVI